MNIVNKLKFSSDSDLFALERDNGVEAIIFDIYQTFDGKDLYSSIEEKAANFLYYRWQQENCCNIIHLLFGIL